jgi:hypothetical protein
MSGPLINKPDEGDDLDIGSGGNIFNSLLWI